LGDDHAGYRFEQLAFARDRAQSQIDRADTPFRGTFRNADQVIGSTDDFDCVNQADTCAISTADSALNGLSVHD
jgi:hypothetical protein